MDLRARIAERLAAETGTLFKEAPERVALVYPSPYSVGMSSLGFLTIYREINARPGRAAERAFLHDEARGTERRAAAEAKVAPLVTYESRSPVGNFRVVAISVAYELEIAGVIQVLEAAGIPPLAQDRDNRHPFILCGGPLTNSNPLPLSPYADAILMGEADDAVHDVLDVAIFGASNNSSALDALAKQPHCFVPSHHGLELPDLAKADHEKLPAYSPMRTPHTELSDMFLVEAERGCSRGCAYCVMRRSTNGGMRIVDKDRLLALVPDDARKVGLVGAAVSDYPKIVEIVETLAAQGRQVSLSSLRPDRLNDAFVSALKKGGAKILTTALDAPSQRLRDSISRKAREQHLVRAAELAKAHHYKHLKLYMMVGLPSETDEDIDELIKFSTELSKIHPLALGIAPFVAKRNTPLDGEPFAGVKVVDKRLARLLQGLKGRVDVRATSARWAWIEYVLAQGGPAEGRAVQAALRDGASFADYKRAFEAIPRETPKRALRIVSL